MTDDLIKLGLAALGAVGGLLGVVKLLLGFIERMVARQATDNEQCTEERRAITAQFTALQERLLATNEETAKRSADAMYGAAISGERVAAALTDVRQAIKDDGDARRRESVQVLDALGKMSTRERRES